MGGVVKQHLNIPPPPANPEKCVPSRVIWIYVKTHQDKMLPRL